MIELENLNGRDVDDELPIGIYVDTRYDMITVQTTKGNFPMSFQMPQGWAHDNEQLTTLFSQEVIPSPVSMAEVERIVAIMSSNDAATALISQKR